MIAQPIDCSLHSRTVTFSRAFIRSLSRLLIGMLLCTQFAIASHACPVMNGAAAMPPGCEQVDPDLDTNVANLCAQHCQQGQQSADTATANVVGMAAASCLYPLALVPLQDGACAHGMPALQARPEAAPEPPHAILHCVFRI